MDDTVATTRVRAGFTTARRSHAVQQSGLDMRTLLYNYPSLGDVVSVYLRGILAPTDASWDHVIKGEPSPLLPYLENLERRHR